MMNVSLKSRSMNRRKFLLIFLFVVSIFIPGKGNETPPSRKYDIVIYGGTSAGIAAAIQGARSGKTVLLIEPSQRIGGLTTGGLGATDIGNKQAIGGISREFYTNIRKYYERPENWKWQESAAYTGGRRNAPGEEAMWTFEPSAALKVYKDMIGREKIELVYGERLNRKDGVKKKGATIEEIVMESGNAYKGRVFIDAAAAAASLAIDKKLKLHEIAYDDLQKALTESNQRLESPKK